jgi:hypothetical protein
MENVKLLATFVKHGMKQMVHVLNVMVVMSYLKVNALVINRLAQWLLHKIQIPFAQNGIMMEFVQCAHIVQF